MRFSDAPIHDPEPSQPIGQAGALPIVTPAVERRPVVEDGKNSKSNESEVPSPQRTAAAGLLNDIFSEFSRLRKLNRSGAWADLEEKVASGGPALISTGMISAKDLVGILIDIEQFRKAEGGSAEVPGDVLAKWLSEGSEPEKPKARKKAKVQ